MYTLMKNLVTGSFLTRRASFQKALPLLACLTVTSILSTCSNDPAAPGAGTGGAPANQASGGNAMNLSSGGAPQPGGTGGVTATGGASSSGGVGTGGMATPASGGTTATGGADSGGSTTGGRGGADGGGGGAAGGAVTGGAGKGGGGATGTMHTGVWKVMPLGDSVTGSTCYPQILSKDLIAGGHTNFQFIGTVTNNSSCGVGAPSVKSEGHGGYGVTFLPSTSTRPKCTKQAQGCGSYAELQTWAAEKPDIVLMHYATNDCWDGEPTQLILSAYVAVIAEFRKQNPNVIFFVSKIIPLTPAIMNAANLNAAVTPAWASMNATANSPIYIIDHATGFNATTDTMDGVHPNPAGAQKMSTASVAALAAAGYF